LCEYNKKAFQQYAERLEGKRVVHTNCEEVIPVSADQGMLGHTASGEPVRDGFKPQGLWYSCGPSWAEWCFAEEFFSCFGDNIFEITINESLIKRIPNVGEFEAFSSVYGYHQAYARDLIRSWQQRGQKWRYDNIKWHKVAENYSGIEIDPYLCERRLDGGLWYYGWDCASGCIWDKEAILDVKKIAFYDQATESIVEC
jgi:hypothetical protein